jgi:hypothetical protein
VRKFGIRLFTLTTCAAALLVVPIIAPAKAGANRSVATDKTKTRNQGGGSSEAASPASSDMRSPTLPSFPPPMYDDLDRKAGGGTGM